MLNWLKTHKLLTGLAIVVILGLWFFLGRGDKSTYEEFTVKRTDIQDTLELSGKVAADRSATLRFGAGGLITYMGAKEGDTVKKWQTLASIDTRQLQKVLEQKLNLYATQRATFDQTVDDNDNSIPSGELGRELERLLAKNQYGLENTVKDVEYQALSLQLARLSSPLEGILVQSPITTADVQVSPTDTWIVVDPTSLYFSADLDETELSRVWDGQKVIISLDAFPDSEINSTIQGISFSPKETSAGTTYEVKLPLTSKLEGRVFRLGLNGTANIVLSDKSGVLTLPTSALSSKNGQSFVLVKKNDKQYEEKVIETGVENAGLVEITSGLSEGDRVYIKK